MTREVAETIADGVTRSSPVVNLEDGLVWVSGMNARPWVLARQVQESLIAEDFDAGEPSDDGAAEHGGLVIEVPAAEPISDEVHQEVFGDEG